MSADNYVLVRSYKGGFLVSDESMSADEPEDADKVFARVGSPKRRPCDAFFFSELSAQVFVDMLYDDLESYFIEYGPDWDIDDG